MKRKQYSNGGIRQTPEQAITRFWSMVDRRGEDECWPWKGALWTGYGFFMSMALLGGKTTAHRVAYMLTHGSIPKGLEIDHKCRNRACQNPKHLEPVTMAVNVLRGEGVTARFARSTHCPRGHERTPGNTIMKVSLGRSYRRCKVCEQAAWRAKAKKRKQLSQHQPKGGT